jgi:hypothetical protein
VSARRGDVSAVCNAVAIVAAAVVATTSTTVDRYIAVAYLALIALLLQAAQLVGRRLIVAQNECIEELKGEVEARS